MVTVQIESFALSVCIVGVLEWSSVASIFPIFQLPKHTQVLISLDKQGSTVGAPGF